MPLHVPVLLEEAVEGLSLRPGGVYVDATFGAGGHSRAILDRMDPTARLVAIDVDPTVLARTDHPDDPRFTLVRANFRELGETLGSLGIAAVDGVLFDLGVSSMQLDTEARGFSFQGDAPLDMRMDPENGITAAEFIAEASETEIADAIYKYGEDRASRKIARAVKHKLPRTTAELARVVSAAVHRPGKRERIHPATRTFQALRIVVNDELASLEAGLETATRMLRSEGRLVAISFHSLEDRIVKIHVRTDPRLRALTRKPIAASPEEQHSNPRARSAKLRVAERVEDDA